MVAIRVKHVQNASGENMVLLDRYAGMRYSVPVR